MNKDNVAEKWKEKLEKVLYVGFGAFGITGGMNNGHTTESMIAIRDKTIEDIEKLFTSHHLSLKEELMKKLPREKVVKDFFGYEAEFEVENTKDARWCRDIYNSCLKNCKEIINQVLKEK